MHVTGQRHDGKGRRGGGPLSLYPGRRRPPSSIIASRALQMSHDGAWITGAAPLALLALLLSAFAAAAASNVCDAKAGGAAGDNATDDTVALQKTIDVCHAQHPAGAVVQLAGGTFRITGSLALTSNLTLRVAAGASLFSAFGPTSPNRQNTRCKGLYWRSSPTAILCGTNLTNVAVIGAGMNESVIDGGGWPWYEAGMAHHNMQGVGPQLFEVAWSRNITLAHLTFQYSPSWTIHPLFSTGVLAHNIYIRNPRFAPNTDGFDPDSCTDVVLRDSIIDTGMNWSIRNGNRQ
jgi:polygalacturonase